MIQIIKSERDLIYLRISVAWRQYVLDSRIKYLAQNGSNYYELTLHIDQIKDFIDETKWNWTVDHEESHWQSGNFSIIRPKAMFEYCWRDYKRYVLVYEDYFIHIDSIELNDISRAFQRIL